MDVLAKTYRQSTARTGSAEPFVHATVLTYATLLLICALLNVFSPAWVSRNATYPPNSSLASEQNPVVSSKGAKYTLGNGLSTDASISRCISRAMMEDISDPVVDRVRGEFSCGCQMPAVYELHEMPTVCAIIQSFNHQANIPKIAKALVENDAIQEIVICEDGSTDDSVYAWMEALRDTKHFIILSNNLHETRCYNRAMRLSSAEFFILMQDDDLPQPITKQSEDAEPVPQQNWVSQALELFDADPKLGVLTGFIGQMWEEGGKGYEFGEQTSDHGGTRKGKTLRIPFLSSRTVRPFMYVECAWIAPVFVRAQALQRIGGLDVGLFRIREPGVWQDCVLSYAAWTAGWRVGVYDSKFQRGVGGHGSASSPAKIKMRDTVWKKAKAAVDSRYDRNYIREHVLVLNNRTLARRYAPDE